MIDNTGWNAMPEVADTIKRMREILPRCIEIVTDNLGDPLPSDVREEWDALQAEWDASCARIDGIALSTRLVEMVNQHQAYEALDEAMNR